MSLCVSRSGDLCPGAAGDLVDLCSPEIRGFVFESVWRSGDLCLCSIGGLGICVFVRLEIRSFCVFEPLVIQGCALVRLEIQSFVFLSVWSIGYLCLCTCGGLGIYVFARLGV